MQTEGGNMPENKTPLQSGRELTISITWKAISAGSDFPEIDICGIELSDSHASWCETFGTEGELHAFLRGVQAGSSMTGGPHVVIPTTSKLG